MRDGFRKILWGFLLVLLEIHIIVIDILPDPVGYFLIYAGINLLAQNNSAAEKAKNIAIGLIIFSIPTIFLQNTPAEQLGNGTVLSAWSIYMNVIGVLKLVLVFYVFQWMLTLVKERGENTLITRTHNTMKVYITALMLVTITQPFVMNMSKDLLIGYTIISVAISLIMEVTFLVLLYKYSKLDDNPINQDVTNET